MQTTITWFESSPDAGPDCLCSLCGQPIIDDIPLRLWPLPEGEGVSTTEARFHPDCLQKFLNPPKTQLRSLAEVQERIAALETAIADPKNEYVADICQWKLAILYWLTGIDEESANRQASQRNPNVIPF